MVEMIKTTMEFIFGSVITSFGFLITLFLGILSIVLPFIALSKVYAQFQKNKEPSRILYILLIISGALWGGIIEVFFTPLDSFNPFPIIFPVIIGYLLGFICKWPNKALLIKIIFNFLMVSFIISPIIVSFTLPSYKLSRSLINKSREKNTKNNLKALRLFIANYYKKNKSYPSKLNENINFFVLLPRKIGHPDFNKILTIRTRADQKIQSAQITDEGGWIYSPDSGDIRINCSHKDSKGVSYYEW